MQKGREGTEVRCPFCNVKLQRPAELVVSSFETAQGGECLCGAWYLADPTGKGVGEAMSLGLGLVADRLGKKVGELNPGQDYEDAVMRYDVRTHRSGGMDRGFADGLGRMYFIRIRTKQT